MAIGARTGSTFGWTTSRYGRPIEMASNGDRPALVGWKAISAYLGQPMSTSQRWAKEGMPVRRQGRNTVASPEELSRWLGRELPDKQPVHIAHDSEPDLLGELRRGLKDVRKRRRRGE